MALQQNRKSKAKCRSRKSANAYKGKQFNYCGRCGAVRRPHVACGSCGYYKDRHYLIGPRDTAE